jgi:hypothetical protein
LGAISAEQFDKVFHLAGQIFSVVPLSQHPLMNRLVQIFIDPSQTTYFFFAVLNRSVFMLRLGKGPQPLGKLKGIVAAITGAATGIGFRFCQTAP